MTWRPLPEARQSDDPKPVAASLGVVARSLGAPDVGVLRVLFARWSELVGPNVAAHASPVGLRDKVLTVAVDDAAWATQLRYLAGDLIGRIAQVSGTDAVAELRLRVQPGRRRTSRS